jgi:hypothetical protein
MVLFVDRSSLASVKKLMCLAMQNLPNCGQEGGARLESDPLHTQYREMEVLMGVTMIVTAFWDVTLCSLVDIY